MRISVLGMGRMGRSVAVRLARGGHEVTVWNRTPDKAAEAVDAGARLAGSIGEATAGAEVVLTSLANDDVVRDVALGDGGIRAHLDTPGDGHAGRRGEGRGAETTGTIYAEASTISPALSAELATVFDRFVALPILGSPQAVSDGEATYLVGGPEELARRLDPLLDTLSPKRHHYPSAPMASAAKLATNLLLLDGLVALAEAVTAARAGGLSDAQLRELFGDSPMLAPGLKNRFEAVLTGAGADWWSVELGRKDARLVLELAAGAGCDLPLTAAARARYDEAAAQGLGDEDVAGVARLYR